MSKIEKLSSALKGKLYDTEEFKQYFYLKQLIENDEQLAKMRKEIALAKKRNDSNYPKLLAQYQSHPLVNNFLVLKEEIKDTLQQIKTILEE